MLWVNIRRCHVTHNNNNNPTPRLFILIRLETSKIVLKRSLKQVQRQETQLKLTENIKECSNYPALHDMLRCFDTWLERMHCMRRSLLFSPQSSIFIAIHTHIFDPDTRENLWSFQTKQSAPPSLLYMFYLLHRDALLWRHFLLRSLVCGHHELDDFLVA